MYKHTRKESYSSLSLFEQCPYSYYQKYIMKNYSNKSTIALDMGSLAHGIMEQKMLPNQSTPFEELENILKYGKKSSNPMDSYKGLDEIKNIYFEDYLAIGRKSGLTYNQKLENLRKRMLDENENGIFDVNKEWNILQVELPFEFEFQGIKIGGKIDKVEINANGDYRITDYKTSDAPFDDKKLKTPLQMYIYAIAIKEIYGKFPIEFVYDIIFLGEFQFAMSKGWEKRGEKALTKLIDKLLECYQSENFIPSPTPLCHWCAFKKDGIVKDPKTENICDYYSLWTLTNRTFEVNKKWGVDKVSDTNNKSKTEFIW